MTSSRMTSSKKLSNVVHNTVFLSVCQFVIKALSAVWTFYLARRLGISTYGLWANLLSLISIFGVLQGFGILGIVFKDISQNAEESRRYFGSALIIYGISSIIAFVLVLSFSWALGYSSERLMLVVLGGLSFITIAPGMGCQSILWRMHDFVIYTVIYSMGTAVYMGLGAILVESGFKVGGIFAALSVGYLITSGTLFWITVRRVGMPIFQGYKELSIYLVKLGFPLVLGSLLTEAVLRIDRVLIDKFLGESAVGFYHAVFNVIYMPREIFLIPFITAIAGKLYASYGHNPLEFRKLFEQANSILLIVVLPILGFCIIFPGAIVHLLYGKNFDPSIRLMPFQIWILLPFFLNSLWQSVLIVKNQTYLVFGINLAGVIFNVLFNILLLPRWGIWAAVFAAVLTQFLILVLMMFFSTGEGLFAFLYRAPRSILACICSLLLIFLLKGQGNASVLLFFVLVVCGSLLYAVFLILFRAVSKEEISFLWVRIKGLQSILKKYFNFKSVVLKV